MSPVEAGSRRCSAGRNVPRRDRRRRGGCGGGPPHGGVPSVDHPIGRVRPGFFDSGVPPTPCHRLHEAPKKHKICSHRGCVNIVKKGGVCIRHGAQARKCSHKGCNNNALNDGVCVRHGAQRATCGHDGCTNKVLKGGVRARHGVTCIIERCTNKVSTGDMCAKHFATIKTMIFRNENARLGKRKVFFVQDVAGMLNKLSRPPPHNINTL